MKKKILFGAVIAAMVLGLVACKQLGDINWGNKGSGDGTQTYKVKQTNDKDHTIRGMMRFDIIPRHQATCVVQQFDQTKTSCDGMVGFITYYTENKDATAANYGTINFLVVGVRNNCGKTETYASYYCNINKDNLSTKNFGCSKELAAYDATVTDPYEVIIVDLPNTKTKPKKEGYLSKTFGEDGTLAIAIQFAGNSDGSIDIAWYGDWDTPAASQAAAQINFDGKIPLLSAKATAEEIGNVVDESDPTSKAKKGTIWAYANIYYDEVKKEGKTLNARWDLYNKSWSPASYADEDGLFEVGDIFFQEF